MKNVFQEQLNIVKIIKYIKNVTKLRSCLDFDLKKSHNNAYIYDYKIHFCEVLIDHKGDLIKYVN